MVCSGIGRFSFTYNHDVDYEYDNNDVDAHDGGDDYGDIQNT